MIHHTRWENNRFDLGQNDPELQWVKHTTAAILENITKKQNKKHIAVHIKFKLAILFFKSLCKTHFKTKIYPLLLFIGK